MRMIKIEDCSKEQFEKIKLAICDVIPYALINSEFVFNSTEHPPFAIFNFWDSDYIPEKLKKYIMQPPLSRENKELLHKKLLEVLD